MRPISLAHPPRAVPVPGLMRLAAALLVAASRLVAQDSTAAVPEIGARVTRLRFFEGPTALPSPRDRQYQARFDSATTRSVYVEIGLSYPPAARAVTIPIDCGYTSPSGASAGSAPVTVEVDQGWELSVHAGGAGGDQAGRWAPGTYTVACRHGGRVIATGSFEITRPGPAPAPPRGARTPVPTIPRGPVNDPNLKAPATLTGATFGSFKGRVTAIRFYESGSDQPDRKDRVITTAFDALTTRFINFEVELEYPRITKTTSFEIACRFEGPDSTSRTPVIRGELDPGWVGSYHTSGWGARNRGLWPEGTYRVSCLGDGKLLVSSEFKIVKARAAVESLGASLTHLRFFQSLAERLPLEARRYGARFDARSARWIKTEFGLVYPGVTSATRFTVECIYTFPDGTLRGVTAERTVPAGWTGSVHAQGIGSDRPGSWPAGSYRVSCRSQGREFGSGSFEVVSGEASPIGGGTLRFLTFPAAGEGAPPAAASSFAINSFDSLLVEASFPTRSVSDSTAFRCGVTDPAGVTWAFSMEGEVRDRSLTGSGRVGGLDPPRERGEYRVECRVGARAVVTERFTLTGAADLPAAGIRLLNAALYEGAEGAPDDEAVSDVSWSAGRIRSLWLVALLERAVGPPGPLPYSCRLTSARGATIADTGPQAVVPAPDDRVLILRQRIGLLPRQKWSAGKLTLACSTGAAVFFRTGIEVTR